MSNYTTEFEGFKRLTQFYIKFSTLPFMEEKTLISPFRIFMSFDSCYEKLNALQIQKPKIDENNQEQKAEEAKTTYTKEMDIEGFEDLPKLFVKPIEKLMDEFSGSGKEFKGQLLKIPTTNVTTGNLHWQICNTV